MDLLRFKLTNILESEFWNLCKDHLQIVGYIDVGDLCISGRLSKLLQRVVVHLKWRYKVFLNTI